MWEVVIPAIVSAVISGVFSGLIAGGKGAANAVKSCMVSYQSEINELSKAVEHLKTEKIKTLEVTIHEHLKDDQTQRFITSMEHMTGAVTKMESRIEIKFDGMGAKMDGKFESVVKELSNLASKVQGQDEKIIAVKEYVHNLDESQQRCKAAHKI